MCLNVSEIIFWIIFVSKRFDAGKSIIYFSKIDFEKCFLVNRTKQPEGCIGISEKCVFVWKSLLVRGLGGETLPPPPQGILGTYIVLKHSLRVPQGTQVMILLTNTKKGIQYSNTAKVHMHLI